MLKASVRQRRRKMGFRRALFPWLGLLLLVMLPACQSQPTPAAPAGESGPRRGGTIVVAVTSDPGQLNPAITTAGPTHVVADNMFNGLIQFDENLNPQPSLAESWSISPDGRAYTFKLARGVRWHDGKPFTAADVKFTFEEVLLKFHARTKAGLENVLAGIDTPDDYTVVFRFREPYAPLLRRLDVVEAPIIPRHIYEGTDILKNPANNRPVGTGPFKFVEYVPGDRVILGRNDDYFKPGLPYLDRAVFKVIPQPSTAVLALEQGEVDYLWTVPGPDIPRLQANPNIVLAKAPAGPGGSFCIDTLIFNLRRPPFDRLELRRAFAHAINRQQLLEQVYFNQGRIATAPIASTMTWAYTPDVTRYDHNPDEAVRLLEAAGYRPGPDGKRLRVTFVHASTYARTAEVIRDNLGRVGVEVELITLEFNAAVERVFVRTDFDLGIASYCNGPDPEIGVTRMYVSSNIKPIPFSNGAAYVNPQVDELFARAATTVEEARRAAIYHEIQRILTRDLPYLWLIETEGYRAFRKDIRDLRIWAGDLLERAWREQTR
jgi:peptide/nickel transport system substrate-binding protein